MQSFLQYRRFRRTLEAQIERNRHRTQTVDRANQDIPLNDDQLTEKDVDQDVEKGEDASSGERTTVDDATLGATTEEPRQRGLEEEEEEYDVGAREEPHDPSERRDHLPPPSTEQRQKQREEVEDPNLSRISTQKSGRSGLSKSGTALGRMLTGIKIRKREESEGGEGNVFIVDYQGEKDPMNPHNWGWGIRLWVTFMVASIGFVVGVASSIDSIAIQPAAQDFGISEVAESLATG